MKAVKLTDFFRESGTHRHYPKGQVLYWPEERLQSVTFIESGLVKIYDADSYGNERTVSIFGKHSVIPISWLLKEQQEVLFHYQTMSEVEGYTASREKLLRFIAKRPDVMLSLLNSVTKAYINQDARVFGLQKNNIRERLEFVLYYLARRLGTGPDTAVHIPGFITQQDLANLTGVTRESISRELNNITATGLIWKDDNDTYIDISKLKATNFPKVFRISDET